MRTSGAISIGACAQRLDVDNRISLRYYYRIADNLLKQADIYRAEKNVIDLYIMLLRFSSLVTETIPRHKDYNITLGKEKMYFKTKLLKAMSELEGLQPVVQNRVEELNRKRRSPVNRWEQKQQNVVNTFSPEYYPYDRKSSSIQDTEQKHRPFALNGLGQGSGHYNTSFSSSIMKSDSFGKIIPRPKEETLSRHSILGPNGLRGQWQPPAVDRGVQYPTNLDFTPIAIPSLHKPAEEDLSTKNESTSSDPEKSMFESVLSLDDGRWSVQAEDTNPLATLDSAETPVQNLPREPSPPPVLADVKDVVHHPSHVTDSNLDPVKSLQDELVPSESPLQLHISTQVMDTFMRVAKSNTDRNLETCGILAGLLKNRKFYVTALIIPKQEATSDSCQTTNEEEIFDVQDKQSLFPLGWIHTHPTQSCFMSSIDLHTHYSYQIMLPEAIAIVMAPRDSARKHGIFRLTTPGGMTVIRQCQQRGFHPHDQPADGGPIYDHCTDVYMNPKVKFDVIDLR